MRMAPGWADFTARYCRSMGVRASLPSSDTLCDSRARNGSAPGRARAWALDEGATASINHAAGGPALGRIGRGRRGAGGAGRRGQAASDLRLHGTSFSRLADRLKEGLRQMARQAGAAAVADGVRDVHHSQAAPCDLLHDLGLPRRSVLHGGASDPRRLPARGDSLHGEGPRRGAVPSPLLLRVRRPALSNAPLVTRAALRFWNETGRTRE